MRVVEHSSRGSVSTSMSVPLVAVFDTKSGIAEMLQRCPVLRRVAVPPTQACQPLAARTLHLGGHCIEFGTNLLVYHTSLLLACCFWL